MGTFTIQKLNGGFKKTATQDFMKSGLVLGGVAASGLALNTTSDELNSAADAEALGIDATYDTTNDVLVYHHIKEFFRMAPSAKLRIRLVAQGTTLTAMCLSSNTHVQKLIDDANGELRRVGVVLNPATGYTPTLTGGLDGDVLTAIDNAKLLAEAAFAQKKFVEILIEGRQFNGTVAGATNLRTKLTGDVQVVILQDPAVAATDALHAKYAAVGTTLGVRAASLPHEDAGYVAKFNLQGDNDEYSSVAISSGALVSTLSDIDLASLTAKGYMLGRTYPGVAGVYFDSNPTCDAITSDFAFAQQTAVINEAARYLYKALFPRMNSPVLINPDNGQIEPGVAKEIEAEGYSSLDPLATMGSISGRDVFVDPNQDIQTTGELVVQFSIIAVGTARSITAKIGYVLKLG